MSSSRETIKSYVAEHQIDRIIKDLTATVLVYRPANPYEFMVEALKAVEEKKDQTDYFDFFGSLLRKQAPPAKEEPAQAPIPTRERRGISFSASEPAESSPAQAPERRRVGFAQELNPATPPVNLGVNFNRKRRGSVSAESLKPSDEEKSDRVVIPKSDEQRMRIFSAIANNLLFRNLESDQRQEVMDAMFEKKVEAGHAVIKQGDEGDNFYVVDEGVFDIFVNGNKVVEISSGGSFGELALMYNTPRAATVQAQTEAVLWAVDRVTFRRIIMNNTFRKRKMYENFVRTVPILQSLEPEERVKVADALEPQTFSDGDNIVEEGDAGDCFYIIVNGEVVVTKRMKKKQEDGNDSDGEEEQVEVNRLTKGQYFGELALLTDKPRAATVTAVGDVECVCLDTKAFIRLLGPVTEILKRNAETYAKYATSISEAAKFSEENES